MFEVSNADYHAGIGISSSHLKEILKSPLHYQNWLGAPDKASTSILIGRAAHCLLLEPLEFEKLFAVAPKVDKRTTVGKDTWKAFEATAGGRQILTAEQHETAVRVVAHLNMKVVTHEVHGNLLVGLKEKAFYWIDEKTGIQCKCKPDVLTQFGIITDLKTTEDASRSEFANSIARYAYHLSAAFYIDGVAEAIRQAGLTGIQVPDSFVIIGAETDYPNGIGIYPIGQASIELGRRLYREALDKIAECSKSGIWPGYQVDLSKPIEVPNWCFYQYEVTHE